MIWNLLTLLKLIISLFIYRCEKGWTGELCDICQTMPGCKHGSCMEPETCMCDPGWIGPLCDCPRCKDGCNMGDLHFMTKHFTFTVRWDDFKLSDPP